jgi:hypothetical protein
MKANRNIIKHLLRVSPHSLKVVIFSFMILSYTMVSLMVTLADEAHQVWIMIGTFVFHFTVFMMLMYAGSIIDELELKRKFGSKRNRDKNRTHTTYYASNGWG